MSWRPNPRGEPACPGPGQHGTLAWLGWVQRHWVGPTRRSWGAARRGARALMGVRPTAAAHTRLAPWHGRWRLAGSHRRARSSPQGPPKRGAPAQQHGMEPIALKTNDDRKGGGSPALQRIPAAAGVVTVGGGSEQDLRTWERLGVRQTTKKGKTWTGAEAHREDGFGGGAARVRDCSGEGKAAPTDLRDPPRGGAPPRPAQGEGQGDGEAVGKTEEKGGATHRRQKRGRLAAADNRPEARGLVEAGPASRWRSVRRDTA